MIAWANVRFRGQSRHHDLTASCPLLTRSGHRPANFAVTHNAAFDDVVGYSFEATR
jgi:hypothetical protein